MNNIRLDISKAKSFLKEGLYESYGPKAMSALKAVEDGTRPGNDFLGWVSLPSSLTPEFLADIKADNAKRDLGGFRVCYSKIQETDLYETKDEIPFYQFKG